MRLSIPRLATTAATFAVGLSFVFIWHSIADLQLGQVIVFEAENIPFLKPRFSRGSRGCGQGYVQSYQTNDGQLVDEGSFWELDNSKTKQHVDKIINNAQRVIERVPNDRDYFGERGERIVLVKKPNEEGEATVLILWYDGGKSYRFIAAPTLDIALEFEQYLIMEYHRSPA